MSEVLASLKKIGGNGEQYTETVLWTNPSPSNNFAAQTITLSDSLSNYKYIGIRFKIHNTHASTPNATGIMLVSEFVQNRKNTGTDRRNILVASQNINNATMARNAWYDSDTSIEFSVAYQISSTNTNTSYVIPLEILGINELAHGTIYEHYATGYFTNTVRSVDLGFVPKYVFCANGGSASGSNNSNIIIYDANVSTTQFKFIANGTEEMRNIGTIGSTVQFSMEGTVIGMNPNTTITNFVNSHRQYVAIGYDNQ